MSKFYGQNNINGTFIDMSQKIQTVLFQGKKEKTQHSPFKSFSKANAFYNNVSSLNSKWIYVCSHSHHIYVISIFSIELLEDHWRKFVYVTTIISTILRTSKEDLSFKSDCMYAPEWFWWWLSPKSWFWKHDGI